MIPRRRIPLDPADLRDWLAAPFRRRSASADVTRFEQAFAGRIGVPHAIATGSGREALALIVEGLGLQPGDEIIFPAYTLGELVPFLHHRGLRLIPADIDPATLNVTVDSVRRAWTPRVRAILAVHLFGAPCDIEGLQQLASERGVPLIEDCAHATGATVNGRAVGSFGIAALFSLESNKALCAFGGGVLATQDPALAAFARQRIAGQARRLWPVMKKIAGKWIEELGVRSPLYAPLARYLFAEARAARFEQAYRQANDRVRAPVAFSGLQARLALRRLQKLDDRNRRLDALWRRLAAALPTDLLPPEREQFGQPAFYNFVARLDGDLPAFRARAQGHGLDLGIRGEVMDDCAAMLGAADCPGPATAFRQTVLVPLYDGMSAATVDRVAARLARSANHDGVVSPALARR